MTHWSEKSKFSKDQGLVPRREITDEMVKTRIRLEKAKKELEAARAELEELERPERQKQQEARVKLIQQAETRLTAFANELKALCDKYSVELASDQDGGTRASTVTANGRELVTCEIRYDGSKG